MDFIDREIAKRDLGEPILVAATAVLFDYVNRIELFERTSAFYDNDAIKLIGLLAVTVVLLRRFVYKFTIKFWNVLSPVKQENFIETVLSRIVPYTIILAAFQFAVTRLSPVEIMADLGWLLLVPIPACIFGTIMVYRIKAMIAYTKSAKYTTK